jgi:hypothetical protein
MSHKNRLSSTIWWIVGTVVVAVVLILLISSASKGNPWPEEGVTTKSNREIALSCTTDMATEFHIHPHLEIIINGKKQEMPADIGVKNSCMNPLHTHDNTGKIHVESPERRDFTLADFFAVWDKTFTKDQILNYKIDETHIIRETVNGVETKDYEDTVLRDDDQIIIYYETKK